MEEDGRWKSIAREKAYVSDSFSTNRSVKRSRVAEMDKVIFEGPPVDTTG